jgi:hypothetical protein
MSLEKIIRISLPYKEKINSFSIAVMGNNSVFVAEQFYNCREIFHEDFPTTKNLLICVPAYKKNRIINFFNFVETKLGIPKKSKVYLTQRKNIFFINLSNFWKSKIKFSLLTLFIRSGLRIAKDLEVDKLIQKYFYLKKTSNAVNVFFSGKTRYCGKKNSWYKEFKNKSMDECLKLLKNPVNNNI